MYYNRYHLISISLVFNDIECLNFNSYNIHEIEPQTNIDVWIIDGVTRTNHGHFLDPFRWFCTFDTLRQKKYAPTTAPHASTNVGDLLFLKSKFTFIDIFSGCLATPSIFLLAPVSFWSCKSSNDTLMQYTFRHFAK